MVASQKATAKGNLEEILANYIEVEVTYKQNFGSSEEAAAGCKHAPAVIMRCLLWNCRGLRRPATERILRGLIRDSNADIIFLSETKVDKDTMVGVMNRLGFVNSCCILANGIAGGFCAAWRTDFRCDITKVFEAGFCVKVQLHGGLPPWYLFCVYGTPYHTLKKPYWEWLTNKISCCNDPWKDSRNAHNRVRKRLDRVAANANWCTKYHKARVVKYPIVGSDHAPIFLQVMGEVNKLKYPFRFLEVWTTRLDCGTIIKHSWMKSINGSSAVELLRKLKGVKYDLKKWNQEVFGFSDRRENGQNLEAKIA
uniref:Endonuclease/exonuclease/phosphatase domain-containing protein n=1 Tax=Cannabis sativa TaxID=3483 RepID=A0A803Q1F3_CANSA